MNLAATIERMKAAGMSSDAIVTALECLVLAPDAPSVEEARAERKRGADRARMVSRRELYEGGPKAWEELRWDLYKAYGGVCQYCSEIIVGAFHIDHILPVAKGGNNDIANLTLACPPCNLSKGSKTLDEWKNGN